MCYHLDDQRLIKIEEKTKQFKYEFLNSYIPMWNKIICGKGRRKRAIIDTHAGTGRVLLEYKEIHGSTFIFLKKTALKQELLNFYFIEKDQHNFKTLRDNIIDICEHGFYFPPVFHKETVGHEKNGLIFEKRKVLYHSKVVYPKREQVHLLKGNCVKQIDFALKNIEEMPAFFFIDPCGKFSWKLIEKIIEKRLLDQNGRIILDNDGKRIQGTELFINFSWEAILRNKTKASTRDNFFKEMYGMSWEDVNNQVEIIRKQKSQAGIKFYEYHLYLEIYMNRLRQYFMFVTEMSIVGIKSEKNPVYCMIFCSSNDIAKKLYENKEVELNKLKKQYQFMKRMANNKLDYTYAKYREFMEGQKSLDDYYT